MVSDPSTPDGATPKDLVIAHRLADAARDAILPHFRTQSLSIDDKSAAGSVFDPVTVADRAAEQAMRALLAELAPNDGVYGEEFGQTDGASGRLWVLDPIDGTRAFMSGILNWGVLIALCDGGRPVLGVMDQPFTQERFFSASDGSAARSAQYFRGASAAAAQAQPIKTRARADLSDATLFTTDPDLFIPGPERSAYDAVASAVKLRRYGTDCYAYAMVAGGFADLVIETGLSPYDIQALIPIVEGAGGIITDWSGAPNPWSGQVIAAGDAQIHAAALALLQPGADPDR